MSLALRNALTAGTKFADSPSVDAFSRLRVSDPAALFSVQCQYDAVPLQLEAGAARALGTLTLVATGIGGTSAMSATINYTEIR